MVTKLLVENTTREGFPEMTAGGSAKVKLTNTDPVPVAAAPRACVGRQTFDVTAGEVAQLTVPASAVAAAIQADGSAISITLDGTPPTAVVGTRLDDGVIYYVDTSLANVKMIARTATTRVQVVYFDKP